MNIDDEIEFDRFRDRLEADKDHEKEMDEEGNDDEEGHDEEGHDDERYKEHSSGNGLQGDDEEEVLNVIGAGEENAEMGDDVLEDGSNSDGGEENNTQLILPIRKRKDPVWDQCANRLLKGHGKCNF